MTARRCKPEAVCPCGSGLALAACCGRYHAGETPATAQALMRSRYSAYVLGDEAYVLSTWSPDTRPAALNLADDPPVKWLGLQVLDCQAGLAGDRHGEVSFVARYKVNGRAQRLCERSRFVHEQGRWWYVDGQLDEHASA